MQLSLPMTGLLCRVSLIGKNQKWTSTKNLENLVSHVQSRLFEADFKHHVAKSFGRQQLLLSYLECLPLLFLLKKGQLSRWPYLVQQISISFIRGSEVDGEHSFMGMFSRYIVWFYAFCLLRIKDAAAVIYLCSSWYYSIYFWVPALRTILGSSS